VKAIATTSIVTTGLQLAAVLAFAVFVAPSHKNRKPVYHTGREPFHGGHCLSFWVIDWTLRQYPDRHIPGDVEALTAIGTNALPFLLDWIRCNVKPSRGRRIATLILKHVPGAVKPQSLIDWADEEAFYNRQCELALSAAAVFPVEATALLEKLLMIRAVFGLDPADGVADEFGHGLELEFDFDVGAMDFHGLGADVQAGRQFFCAQPLAYQLKDFKFPICQLFDR
jgi:hypothetical protein